MVCNTPTKKKINPRNHHFLKGSFILFLAFILCSWYFIFYIDRVDLKDVFSQKNVAFTSQFLKRLISNGETRPAYLTVDKIKYTWMLMINTFKMSIIAITFASVAMFLSLIPFMQGHMIRSTSGVNTLLTITVKKIIQVTFLMSRAIPELIWAMLLVFILQPGILPGAFALAIHNYGILGKLCLEVIENMEKSPLQGLEQCGAQKNQIMIYGVIPIILPKLITYIVYRWEVILRTTIVVGMVGAGGLGNEFKLRMSWFHYTDVTLILMAYLLLVYLSDLISKSLRKAFQ